MAEKLNESILAGTITRCIDVKRKTIFHKLHARPKNQIIEIMLDENFWQISYLKSNKVKIIIEDGQIPKNIMPRGRKMPG